MILNFLKQGVSGRKGTEEGREAKMVEVLLSNLLNVYDVVVSQNMKITYPPLQLRTEKHLNWRKHYGKEMLRELIDARQIS